MKLHLSTWTVAACAYVSFIAAAPNGAPVEVLQRVGPYGSAWSDAAFDDTYNFPTTRESRFSIFCRSGDRLDYIHLEWFNVDNKPLAKMAHGNIYGGDSHQFVYMTSSDDITSINVHVCTGKRNKGKICGVKFGIRDQQPFACGVLNADGAQPTVNFDATIKFFALFGGTQNNLKTITKLGIIATRPK